MTKYTHWLQAATVVILALIMAVIVASMAGAQQYTLLDVAAPKCERCEKQFQRCVQENCPASPSPLPTRSPSPTPTAKPTGSPLPCEPPGTKTYQVGEEKLMCFDAGPKRPFMEVSVVGLPSCGGELAAQLQAPSGARFNALGAQPNTILPWEAGKWYLWTKLVWGNCTRSTFTPR